MVKRQTISSLLKIAAWSFKMMAMGSFPVARHDGTPWLSTDHQRAKQAGNPMHIQGFLIEARGDWAFYKDIFELPAWNAKEGMCWKCHADKASFRLPGLDAPWRCTRYMPGEFMASVRHQGLAPCPLFSIPGFTVDMILIDWLHTADIGIAGDVVGNIFNEVAKLLPGGTKLERAKVLWSKVKL